MKIAIIIPSLGMGGAERVAVSFANWLAKKNIDTYIINMSTRSDNYKISDNVKVYNRKNEKITKYNLLKRINRKYRYILNSLEEIRPNIIFEMLYYPIPYLMIYKLRNRKVTIIGSERNNPKIRNKSLKDKILCHIAPKFCDGYIFQTEKVKRMFNKKVQAKSAVVANAIDIKDVQIHKSYKKQDSICNVGRLNYQKGQDTLIKAFSIVHNKIPQYKLIIYGEGKEKEKLEKLIEKLNLKEVVILAGNKGNIIEEISKSKIFVFTSRYEGMPNALLEAMACGMPCIATDCVAGPSEIIENNKNGILVEVDNVTEIANKIIYLIENKEKRNELGNNAKKVIETYSKDNIFNSYYNYFIKCYERKIK